MQFFNAIIVFASLAAAAPTAGNAPAVKAEELTSNTPCPYNIQPVWNDGNYGKGDGGWGCEATNNKGVCTSYFWKTQTPYWSCP